jgi:pyrroline-5-carboxylate reductase
MPNTPALVGQGMTGLFACPSVSVADKGWVEQIIQTTGQYIWVEHEAHLDAVTALSGSGPAYVFYFLEAMTQAGVGMGLSAAQAYQLAVATFSGASSLAAASTEPAEVLRQRVTSKGGTTYAAITALDASGVKASFVMAMQAAELRARELGDEFGKA